MLFATMPPPSGRRSRGMPGWNPRLRHHAANHAAPECSPRAVTGSDYRQLKIAPRNSDMKLSLQLKLGQQLTMTPQLQQAIRLLQLSTLDLQQEIQEALESNPMLEIEEDFEPSEAPASS